MTLTHVAERLAVELAQTVFMTQVRRNRGFNPDLPHPRRTLYLYATAAALGNYDHERMLHSHAQRHGKVPLRTVNPYRCPLSNHRCVDPHSREDAMDISQLLFSTEVFMNCFDVLSYIMHE